MKVGLLIAWLCVGFSLLSYRSVRAMVEHDHPGERGNGAVAVAMSIVMGTVMFFRFAYMRMKLRKMEMEYPLSDSDGNWVERYFRYDKMTFYRKLYREVMLRQLERAGSFDRTALADVCTKTTQEAFHDYSWKPEEDFLPS